MKLELIAGKSAAKIAFKSAPRLHADIHLTLEKPIGSAAFALGAIESKVGVLHQLVGIAAIHGRNRDADARSHRHLVLPEVERCGDRFKNPFGERCGGTAYLSDPLNDAQLIAAQARKRVSLSNTTIQALCDGLQQLIPDGMPERIIDLLEPVEIQDVHGQLALAIACALGSFIEALAKNSSVRQAGQHVVPCHVGDLGFGPMPFGDVHIRRKEAAIIERYAAHVEDRSIRSLALKFITPSLSGERHTFIDLLFDIAGPEFAAVGVEADQVLEGRAGAREQMRRKIEQRLRSLVANQQTQVTIEQTNAAREIVDNGLEVRGSFREQFIILLKLGNEALAFGEAALTRRFVAFLARKC